MTIIRPRLRAAEVRPGDRLLVADDLDLVEPLPAMPVVEGVQVTGETVKVSVAGRAVLLPADAEVVVERSAP